MRRGEAYGGLESGFWTSGLCVASILSVKAGLMSPVDGVAPDLAMHLLALHWNRQHFAFLISYRPRESPSARAGSGTDRQCSRGTWPVRDRTSPNCS